MIKISKLVRCISCIALLISFSFARGGEVKSIPVIVPFNSIEGSDSLKLKIKIERRTNYVFGLRFFYLPSDRDDKSRLLGPPLGAADSYDIKVNLTIRRTDTDQPFHLSTTVVPKNSELATEYVSKLLADVNLMEGTYEIEVRSINLASPLKGRKMLFTVGTYPN